MPLTTMGDLASNYSLRRHVVQARRDIQQQSAAMVTGRAVDVPAALGGDLRPLIGIDASLARLRGHSSAAAAAGLLASAMQTAVTLVDETALSVADELRHADPMGTALPALGQSARQGFATAIAALNRRLGDQAIFAGNRSDAVPLPDAETLLTALEAATAGAVTADQIEVAVAGWFAAPDGFAASYRGGAPRAPFAIAAGEQVALDVTADDPALRNSLRGLAIAAMLAVNRPTISVATRLDLARRAAADLEQGAVARAQLSGRIGQSEQKIENAVVHNGSENLSLQTARAGIAAADPYEAATKVQEAEARLETLYALTARMARLNLVDFLR